MQFNFHGTKWPCVLLSDALSVCEKLSNSMENIRSDFAMETDGGGMVGIQSARGNSAVSTNPLNFSLRNFGTELRWVSTKHFRSLVGWYLQLLKRKPIFKCSLSLSSVCLNRAALQKEKYLFTSSWGRPQ